MLRWRPIVPGDGDDLPPFARRPRKGASGASWRRSLAELPLLVVIAMMVAFVLKSFVAQAFFIPSGSMEPQLREGDRVVVSRLAYRFHEPRRGDLVVFPQPDPPGVPAQPQGDRDSLPVRVVRQLFEGVGLLRPPETELIKRIVGLPGESIEARDGGVYVNGQVLVEPYLPPGVLTPNFEAAGCSPICQVPADHVFVLGDNRGNSRASNDFGPVPIDSIVGRAIVRAWPPWRWAYL